METARYAPIPDEVRGSVVDYFALKAASARTSLLKTQAELDTLRLAAETAQPQSWWRRIVMGFARVMGNLPIEVRVQRAGESITRASSSANHFESLVADTQEGRVDRIEAQLLKDIDHGFDSLRMRGPGWSPDEDYSGWKRIRAAGYLQASEAVNLLEGISSPQAPPLRLKLKILAEECLNPNYD